MNKRLALLIGCFLAGCAVTTQASNTPSDAPQMADALPPLGEAEDVGGGDVTPPITGNCGMESLQHYVGQPRTSVPRSAMPDLYRVVGPNTPVTMDYRANRLTIRVNEQDVVESMACG
ncbi:I78 family peptidase inhibitor [Maricaulis parjimensis]|uniref:I78 family peptidase inhibitor n=1 Tax=Maricaulis parjimensis TaxID=144023 RepID=UPI001939B2A5|nr:I78 family peptidase inhibitor [Maricaulis parjimensis]